MQRRISRATTSIHSHSRTTNTAKYSTMAKAQGAKFLPFAVEMYGGMAKSAKQLLQLINKSARDQMLMWPYQQIMQNLKGDIAISIQRGNAIAILAGYQAICCQIC